MQDSRRFVASHEQPEKGSTASFHLIILCIGELQRQLGGLYVKRRRYGAQPSATDLACAPRSRFHSGRKKYVVSGWVRTMYSIQAAPF